MTIEEIKAFMKEKGLATYKVPERLETISVMPRNPVGKILKKTLRKISKEAGA